MARSVVSQHRPKKRKYKSRPTSGLACEVARQFGPTTRICRSNLRGVSNNSHATRPEKLRLVIPASSGVAQRLHYNCLATAPGAAIRPKLEQHRPTWAKLWAMSTDLGETPTHAGTWCGSVRVVLREMPLVSKLTRPQHDLLRYNTGIGPLSSQSVAYPLASATKTQDARRQAKCLEGRPTRALSYRIAGGALAHRTGHEGGN